MLLPVLLYYNLNVASFCFPVDMFTMNSCNNVAITFTKCDTGECVFMKFGIKKFLWIRNSYSLVECLN
jgi:hypothetical protein